MMLMNNVFAQVGGGLGLSGPLGPTSAGHGATASQWYDCWEVTTMQRCMQPKRYVAVVSGTCVLLTVPVADVTFLTGTLSTISSRTQN
jgi:hypothetical protein|eukprot:COSAG06_NODE_2855_length_6169_cov_7.820264_7_plen_88_part_00